MAKIYIDPGHGGHDGGASRNGLVEKRWVLEVSLELAKILRSLGHSVRLSRTNDTFISLNARSADANRWGADIFLSVHFNAGGGHGWEDFIFNGRISNNTRKLQNDIHEAIKPVLKKHGMGNRGKKRANFSVLRQTNAPAILIEAGFVDTTDNAIMKKASYKKDVAIAMANGVQKYFGLGGIKDLSPNKPTVNVPKGTLYRVQLGAFSKKSNADALSKQVKSKTNADTYIVESANLYRVQVGAYAQKRNADNQLKKMKDAGFKDAFITTNSTAAAPSPKPKPTPAPKPSLSVNQMARKVINDPKAPTGDARAKWLGISVNRYRSQVQPEINRILGSGSTSRPAPKTLRVGSKVKIKSSATHYATGQRIPSRYKNKTYTIMQVNPDRVLLREIMSWVKKNDVV